jgi:hypothetical protein
MANPGSDEVEVGKGSFDKERSGDLIHREFADAPMGLGINPVDGLPSPIFPNDDMGAPPLTIDTFICMEDERSFVIREDRWGDVIASFPPEDVEESPNGRFYVTVATAKKLEPEVFKKLHEYLGSEDILTLEGQSEDYWRIEVWPVRERCHFLIAMMTGFEGGTENVDLRRLCGLRHDEGGDFMSLRDEMMIACVGRSPRDFVSVDRVRKFNKRSIEQGAERAAGGGVYDVNKLDAPDEFGGIFK